MSAYDFACVWKDSEATGSALLVHLALADCAINGIARVRHEDLARLSRLHVASVGRAIEQLAASGQIIIAEPKAGTRPAQIIVWPMSQVSLKQRSNHRQFEGDQGYCSVFPEPIILTAAIPDDHSIHAPDTPLMRHLKSAEIDGSQGDPGPTEIVDPLLDAIMGMPDEAPGYAYSAPAAIQPVEPPRQVPASLIAPGDVARVLNAAGVPKNEELPGYWWRSEHKADLADLCARLGITVDVCIERITKGGRSMPDLRRIGELEPLVRGPSGG